MKVQRLALDALAPWAALAAVAALGLYLLTRKGAAAEAGESIGKAAVDLVAGAGSGVVLGLGDAVGIPRTDRSACEIARANGDAWEASKVCPAWDYVTWAPGHLWDKINGNNSGSVSGSW